MTCTFELGWIDAADGGSVGPVPLRAQSRLV